MYLFSATPPAAYRGGALVGGAVWGGGRGAYTKIGDGGRGDYLARFCGIAEDHARVRLRVTLAGARKTQGGAECHGTGGEARVSTGARGLWPTA